MVVFSTTKRLRFDQPNKRGDKWESRGVGQENVVLFIGAESGSVLVFVEVKLLVGFGFCKSLKVGILYRTYEKVSRPGPCNSNGDPYIILAFPYMGVPLNHPFLGGLFLDKPFILRVPQFMETPIPGAWHPSRSQWCCCPPFCCRRSGPSARRRCDGSHGKMGSGP